MMAAELSEGRAELLWAAQLPAAACASLLTSREDDAHLTLGWSPRHEALLGRSLGAGGACVGLRPRDLSLVMIVGGELVREHALAGRTFVHGLRWLAGALDPLGEGLPAALSRPDHALPDHPVARGETFSAGGSALLALTDWIADGHHLLEALRREGAASEVRCDPRTLALETRIEVGSACSVDAGLSLASALEPAPCFYVASSVAPATTPVLPAGARWHIQDAAHALLPGTALDPDAGAQREQARTFFETAIRAHRSLAS